MKRSHSLRLGVVTAAKLLTVAGITAIWREAAEIVVPKGAEIINASIPTYASSALMAAIGVAIAILRRVPVRSGAHRAGPPFVEESMLSKSAQFPSQRTTQYLDRFLLGWLEVLGLGLLFGIVLLLAYQLANDAMPLWLRAFHWLLPLSALFLVIELRAFANSQRSIERSIRFTILYVACLFLLPVGVVAAWEDLVARAEVFRLMTLPVRIASVAAPTVLIAGLLMRWVYVAFVHGRPRVFISFQNTREADAVSLQVALERQGIVARRVPFQPGYEHDNLLSTIQSEIRNCDVMVCIPGDQPSFVEHEVLVASTLRKLIVFLVEDKDPRLPNTAYYGYPVFLLHRARRRAFLPVGELIRLSLGDWDYTMGFGNQSLWDKFPDMKMPFVCFLALIAATYLSGAVVAFALESLHAALEFVASFHSAYWMLIGGFAFAWFWFLVLMLGLALAITQLAQVRARRILQQHVLTGRGTHDELRKQLSTSRAGRVILGCMYRVPPPARHEHEAAPQGVNR